VKRLAIEGFVQGAWEKAFSNTVDSFASQSRFGEIGPWKP
jgi:hypothetical protein